MTQVWAPRHASSRTGACVFSIARAASYRASPRRLVGAHLVAGDAVGLERRDHRGRSPAAVVAVPPALPFADLRGELLLEGERQRRLAVNLQDHLGAGHGAPLVIELLADEVILGVLEQVDVDADALRLGRRRRGRRRTGLERRRRPGRGLGLLRDGSRGDLHDRRDRAIRRRVDQQLDPRGDVVQRVAEAERVARPDGQQAEGEHDGDGMASPNASARGHSGSSGRLRPPERRARR